MVRFCRKAPVSCIVQGGTTGVIVVEAPGAGWMGGGRCDGVDCCAAPVEVEIRPARSMPPGVNIANPASNPSTSRLIASSGSQPRGARRCPESKDGWESGTGWTGCMDRLDRMAGSGVEGGDCVGATIAHLRFPWRMCVRTHDAEANQHRQTRHEGKRRNDDLIGGGAGHPNGDSSQQTQERDNAADERAKQ